ncbi:MAG: FAD-binding protein [Chloroflexi bacterium]|nr:FAD-binding protein [Chloroflexota bacterium]
MPDILIQTMAQIVGAKNVITGHEEMASYTGDESPTSKPHYPDIVVKPGDTAEVAAVLALANQNKIAVTPRGAGTGISGGAVPIKGGIVLSMERMNRILEIDADNFVVVTQPGVRLMDLCQAVEAEGLYYPLYPGEKSAFIGGNVATNAGGMRAVRYGVTRSFVLGLEAVLSTGQIVRTGGKYVKCSTGYDLTQLLIGSEGTLAVITEVILKLSTPPGMREVLWVPFTSLQQAIKTVPQILKTGVPVIGLEFLEKDIIDMIEQYLERKIPFSENPAFLLVILEGATSDEVYESANRISEVCTTNGAVDVYIPTGEHAKRELLEAREKMFPAIRRYDPIEVVDAVVPRSRIADFVSHVKGISIRYKISITAPGHAGDGNVHLHLMGKGIAPDEWESKVPEMMNEIYSAAVAMGGTISGEHGIGYEKKKYLHIAMDEHKIDLMRRVKAAFDPNCILNPGKVFDL